MRKTTLALATAALLAAGSAAAHGPTGHRDLDQMSARADLVFKGRVVDVDYRLSEPGPEQPALPHTFVTYAVDEVIQGQSDGKTLTLRFLGGRGEGARFMRVSGYPLFDLGDEDLLFVKANTEAPCPLVGCAKGRFRIIEGQVYGEDGRQVLMDEKGRLRPGRRVDLEAVDTHKVSQTVIRIRHFDEPIARPKGQHLDGFSFMSHARDALYRAQQQRRQAPGLTRSADIERPFSVNRFGAVAPGQDMAPATAPKPAAGRRAPTAQEQREIDAIRGNGGNPVIDR